MDPRVSTAPTPKERKRVFNNAGSSCQPSGDSANDSRPDISSPADRPQTCPTPALTPQFHWNLNNSALKTLSRNQIKELYGLFKFYDSSTIGDDLPSINCARLVEILRDARLLNESTSASVIFSHEDHGSSTCSKWLQVEAVEKIFAQAVMGKMRVYLDADGQPALTFPLFCGALMNCATLLTPLAHPEAALRQVLPILLEGSIVNGHHGAATKSLLSHLPIDGSISLWMPGQAHGPDQPDYGQSDFRELPPFQQVIADCTRDKVLDELKQEKLARRYQIPDHLVASFHPETLALISTKFRMFDVFDRGMLPRQEVFSLLSSLGRHADLPNPYAVLTALSASNLNTESNGEVSTGGEITLAQLLQTIETTRKSKRYSLNAQFAAMKVNSIRVDPTAAAVGGETPSTKPMSSFQEEDTNDNNNTDAVVNSLEAATHSPGSSVSKERGKRTGIPRAGNSSYSLLHNKHHSRSKATLAHHASVSGKKKAEFHRKPSSKTNLRQAAESSRHHVHGDHGVSVQSLNMGNHSQRSGTTIYSNGSNPDEEHAVVVPDYLSSRSRDLFNSECISQRSATIRRLIDLDHEAQSQYLLGTPTDQVHELSTANNSKMIWIFLLLGGDHDGAICCTISLVFATKEIAEREGIYYPTAPSETTRTTPVLPTQKSLMNALLMLKKCVLARQEQGFKLRPTDQLDAVDGMLQELEKKQPRVSAARSPTSKTLRGATTALASSPAGIDFRLNAFPTSLHESREQLSTSQNSVANNLSTSVSSPGLLQVSEISSATPGQMYIANTSPSRSQKAPPLSKPVHQHQIKLPSNYRELFAVWEVAQNDTWIHDLNAASPLRSASPTRTQSTSFCTGHLSPLHFP